MLSVLKRSNTKTSRYVKKFIRMRENMSLAYPRQANKVQMTMERVAELADAQGLKDWRLQRQQKQQTQLQE